MQVVEVIEKLFSEIKVIKSAGRDTPYGKSSNRENFEKIAIRSFTERLSRPAPYQ